MRRNPQHQRAVEQIGDGHPVEVHKAQVHLVDERSRLKRMIAVALESHSRDPSQVRIDDGHQAIQGCFVARPPVQEKGRRGPDRWFAGVHSSR
jgi:hypothetical protein